MENYKEKYEQALENLKRIKNANRDNKELVDFIEYQYPELKESEDERIRKALIQYIKEPSVLLDWRKKEFIVWLKKQGEQKLIDKFEPKPYFYCKYGGIIPKCSDCVQNHLNSKYKTEEIKTWMIPGLRSTKQCSSYIQQKPAGWNEEDVEMIDLLISILEINHPEAYFKSTDKGDVNMRAVPTKKITNWLKSLKERIKGE